VSILSPFIRFEFLVFFFFFFSRALFYESELSGEKNIDLNVVLTIDSLYYVFSIFGNEMSSKRANFKILYKNYVMTNFFSAPMHHILKRRVAQIIGNWSSEINNSGFAVYSMGMRTLVFFCLSFFCFLFFP
jgi:hypothetical protein